MTSPLIESLIRQARRRCCTVLTLLLALVASLMQAGLLDMAELASQSVGAGVALLLLIAGGGR